MAATTDLERYRTISTLGAGGMGTVVLAEDTVLGREVALKRVATEGDVRALSRLRREALVGASINHRNLVSVYDVITTGSGDAVIVMEYVPGETLRERLVRQGRLSPAEALPILSGVAAGLDEIHGRGIVHRDVKPANILLGPDGMVKLADLGIAAAADRTQITTAGTVLGSFRYMAPEQMEGPAATPAVDVYGLAAVAFEALSGKRARDESNPMALAHAIATQPPPNLRDAWPEAPAAAAEVLGRGMSRDPAARPRSAGELVSRLGAALDPQPTESVPAARPRRPAVPVPVPVAMAAGRGRAAAVSPTERRRAAEPPGGRGRPAVPLAAGRGRPLGSPDVAGDSDRTRRFLPALLLLLAAAVVAVVLATQGGASRPTRLGASASHHGTRTAKKASPSGARTTAGSGTRAGAGSSSSPGATSGTTAGAGSGTSSGAGSSASSSAAGGPAAAASPASGSSQPPSGTAGSSQPASAVESFYHLAASHDYAAAWALADPAFRQQLGGYASFQAGQSGDKSITFHQARVVNETGSSAAVAISTTSVRTDGTQQCSGTVDLARGGPGWLLHQIHINCA